MRHWQAWLVLGSAAAAFGWVDKDTASVLARRNFWSFQKPVRPDVPAIRDPWIHTPVDAFILATLRERKLTPSADASRTAWIRRVTLDTTGLPPTAGEVELFLRDRRPDAFERVVDRLLASPHYGERWAQRWLDVVRYADTNGYELDADRPHAWRYRDYVVRSFNADKPYNRFVREQIAGDELYPDDIEAKIATGFHRAGPIHLVGGNQDEEMNRQEVLTEMASSIGSVFLGLTVGCARCHNHKFDPILQADYYRLQAVFAGSEGKDIDFSTPEQKTAYEAAKKAYEARLDPIKKQIEAIDKPYREKLRAPKLAKLPAEMRAVLDVPKDQRTEEQKKLAKIAETQSKVTWDELLDALPPAELARRQQLREELHRVELTEPEPLPHAYATVNMEKPAHPTHILKVGDHKQKLAKVDPGLPVVFQSAVDVPLENQGRRSALAEWLTSPDHPLTARVMVNRIWQFRIGHGIVRTPNDFGLLGERPTHPKLLDWLATEFIAKGWSIKALDRMILLSSVYRQQFTLDAAKETIDAENKYLWRMNRKRMEAEEIRDSVLAVSGTLETRLGGRPVRIPIEPEVYDLLFTEGERDGLWLVDPDPAQHARRSLYLLNKRSVRLPMLAVFDQPDAMTSCPARFASTHALQALTLFNSDFMAEQSKKFASRLERECGKDRGCAVRRAYVLALSRQPRPAEIQLARGFLTGGGLLADFCLAMLNRNEFVYVQ
jgi:hypothetical protein